MKWARKSVYHEASECGRFTINRAAPVGPDGRRSYGYLAWARSLVEDVPGQYPWGVIGCYPSVETAREACERHAREVFRDAA